MGVELIKIIRGNHRGPPEPARAAADGKAAQLPFQRRQRQGIERDSITKTVVAVWPDPVTTERPEEGGGIKNWPPP